MNQGKPPKGGSSVAPMLPRGGSTDLPQPEQPNKHPGDRINVCIKRIEEYLSGIHLFDAIDVLHKTKEDTVTFSFCRHKTQGGRNWRIVLKTRDKYGDTEDMPLLEAPFKWRLLFAEKYAVDMIEQAVCNLKVQARQVESAAMNLEQKLTAMNIPELDDPRKDPLRRREDYEGV